jgi:hypothetical protein
MKKNHLRLSFARPHIVLLLHRVVDAIMAQPCQIQRIRACRTWRDEWTNQDEESHQHHPQLSVEVRIGCLIAHADASLEKKSEIDQGNCLLGTLLPVFILRLVELEKFPWWWFTETALRF